MPKLRLLFPWTPKKIQKINFIVLQENNLRLLATIRKLSEESEVAESAAVAEKTRDLNIEVTSLRSQLKSMQDSRANTMQLVERLKKEYESQKSLADSLNMSIQQRNEGMTMLLPIFKI